MMETRSLPAEQLMPFLHELADASEAPCLRFFRSATSIGNKVTEKSAAAGVRFDPVTEADRQAEQTIRDLIHKRYPGHGIIGEELSPTNPQSAIQWVLDPIDGTRNYIAGLPTWGTLIGVMENGEARAGMMNQPYMQERYWSDGTVSMHRDRFGETVLATRQDTTNLADAVIAASSPPHSATMFLEPGEATKFTNLASACQLTRYGGDCHNYARLAAGQIDIVAEATLAPYDIVALIPIITAAGGIVTTWSGAPATEGGAVLATANATLHDKALKMLT